MLLFACFMICGSAALAAESLLVNGALEDGLRGWAPFWSRTPKTGTATLDRAVRHAGAQAVRIDHKGAQDWSFGQQKALPVTPGQIFAFSASDGKQLAERKLASPPVWDGMAAAGGRLYLSTMDGKVVCFAAP